jgi:hypothetical protein
MHAKFMTLAAFLLFLSPLVLAEESEDTEATNAQTPPAADSTDRSDEPSSGPRKLTSVSPTHLMIALVRSTRKSSCAS